MGGRLEGYCGKGRHDYGDPKLPGMCDDSQFLAPRVKVSIGAPDWRAIGTAAEPHKRETEEETVTVGIQQAWTSKQEQTLAKLRAEGLTWDEIAAKMGGTRTGTACRVHYDRYVADQKTGTEPEAVPQTEPIPIPGTYWLPVIPPSEGTMAGTILQSSEEAACERVCNSMVPPALGYPTCNLIPAERAIEHDFESHDSPEQAKPKLNVTLGAVLESKDRAEYDRLHSLTDDELHAEVCKRPMLVKNDTPASKVQTYLRDARDVEDKASSYCDWLNSTIQTFGQELGAVLVTSAPRLSELLTREW